MFEISKLKEKKLSDLQQIAEELNISKFKTLKKLDLVYKILDHQASNPETKNTSPKKESNPVKKESNPVKKESKSAKKDPENYSRQNKNHHRNDKKDTAKDLKHLMEIGIIGIVIENLTMNLMQSLRVKVS